MWIVQWDIVGIHATSFKPANPRGSFWASTEMPRLSVPPDNSFDLLENGPLSSRLILWN